MFQFLTVQLKDDFIIVRNMQDIVSIPYGTIKSSVQCFRTITEFLFQFLTVQLKGHQCSSRQ